MDFSAAAGRGEPARWLDIAGKLLAARDLVGCKRLAERAVDADPLLPGADELLAVADVHLASQRLLPSGRPDPLAVLQLQPDPDAADVKRSFRRLANLLASPRNPHPGADTALRAVEDAYAHLTETTTSSTATASAPAAPGGASAAAADTFWTACPHCCHVHQYERALAGRKLRCPSAGCRQPFVATEIPSAPPVVPGTNMYYCAWGFVPMGFPKPADVSTNWKPFRPMPPRDSSAPQPASVSKQTVVNNSGHANANAPPSNAHPAATTAAGGGVVAGPPRGKMKKTTARKKVGSVQKKHASSGVESGIEPSLLGSDWNRNMESGIAVNSKGININEVAKPTDGGSTMLHFGGDADIGFDLDVDAADDIMGNLHSLPFLREDDSSRRLF